MAQTARLLWVRFPLGKWIIFSSLLAWHWITPLNVQCLENFMERWEQRVSTISSLCWPTMRESSEAVFLIKKYIKWEQTLEYFESRIEVIWLNRRYIALRMWDSSFGGTIAKLRSCVNSFENGRVTFIFWNMSFIIS